MKIAYFKVNVALSCFSAPIFCAQRAETVESIEDGTRNKTPITFSTIPTAAASESPLRLAMIVIRIKEI